MKNFRTYQMALELYREGKKLELKGEIRDQLERASLSVVLNLAEGSAKMGQKERRRFFTIAMGSLRETQACLEINNSGLLDKVDRLAASLHCLIQRPGPGPAA
jgi:four helix bundle protein